MEALDATSSILCRSVLFFDFNSVISFSNDSTYSGEGDYWQVSKSGSCEVFEYLNWRHVCGKRIVFFKNKILGSFDRLKSEWVNYV